MAGNEIQGFIAKNNAEARLMQVLKLPETRTKSVTLRAEARSQLIATVEIVLTDAEIEAIFGPDMRGHGNA